MNTRLIRRLGLVPLVIGLGSLAHANAPSGRYTMSSGSVYDTKTKLTWQQTVSTQKASWEAAKNYCASIGGIGWHLPTMKELQTIVDYSRSNPSVDANVFPSTPADWFWSATSAAKYASSSYPQVWAIDFYGGVAQSFELVQGYEFYVRCVH
jgi:hypothetical protein